jgi:hypothetical protein
MGAKRTLQLAGQCQDNPSVIIFDSEEPDSIAGFLKNLLTDNCTLTEICRYPGKGQVQEISQVFSQFLSRAGEGIIRQCTQEQASKIFSISSPERTGAGSGMGAVSVPFVRPEEACSCAPVS